jgi:hypothetical protein
MPYLPISRITFYFHLFLVCLIQMKDQYKTRRTKQDATIDGPAGKSNFKARTGPMKSE